MSGRNRRDRDRAADGRHATPAAPPRLIPRFSPPQVFAAVYGVALYACYVTIGDPYREAVKRREEDPEAWNNTVSGAPSTVIALDCCCLLLLLCVCVRPVMSTV